MPTSTLELIAAAAGLVLVATLAGHWFARRSFRRQLAAVSQAVHAAPVAHDLPARDPDAPPPAIARITERRQARRMLRAEVAVLAFLEFLRARNHTGWFAARHIDDLWTWFCDLNDIVPIDAAIIRGELAAMPACRHAQKRLKGPEFAHVREDLGRDRAWVYYIPPANVPLDQPGTGEAAPRRSKSRHGPVRSGGEPSGIRPATGTRGGTRPARQENPDRKRTSGRAMPGPGSSLFDFSPAELAA